nr:Do family serine endopeptidase [Sphingomonas japonica]
MTLDTPLGAQTAQNEPGAIQAQSPRAGAPTSFADMVARLQPAVVNISTTQRVTVQNSNPFAGTPFENFFGNRGGGGRPTTREGQSLGSGFIISEDGYVVTNNHVISPGARNATVESVTVTLSDGKEYVAKVVGRDEESDLAVLKIDGDNLPFVRFGDSKQARVGDWVVAIGNPFGLGGTVTAGIISALNRVAAGPYDRFIQTDASINQGNSGGPMFDMQGNVIGINSQILSPTGGNVGVGFAIPAEQAAPIVATLRRGDTVTRGYLGVGIQPVTPEIAAALGLEEDRGEIIRSVEPDQAAQRAGIRPGDIVVGVAGQEVTEQQTLSILVANTRPGTRLPIELIRDGRRQTVTATVGTRPSQEELAGFQMDEEGEPAMPDPGATADATLGLSVQALTPQIARSIGVDPSVRGVVVSGADPSSDAGQKGIRRGDVIISINRQPVTSAADITRGVAAARSAGRDQVLLYIQRGRGAPAFFPIEIAE